MRCDEARENLPDYLTGTLEDDAGRSLVEHLDSCPRCRQEFEESGEFWESLSQIQVPAQEAADTRNVVMATLRWRSHMRTLVKAVAVILAVAGLAAGGSLLLKREAAGPAEPSTASVASDGMSRHEKGPANAPVTLVEYGDYECPPCALYRYPAIIDQLIEKYAGTLHYEFRHFPIVAIHPNAMQAAIVAEAASVQGKFWDMHNALLQSRSRWIRRADAADVFLELASEVGLDRDAFQRSLVAPELEERVREDLDAGRREGVVGTPTFILNGMKLDDAPRSFEDFDGLIMDSLRRLKLEEAQGR